MCTLYGKKDSAEVIKLAIFRWGIIPDYLGTLYVITRVFIRESQEGQRGRRQGCDKGKRDQSAVARRKECWQPLKSGQGFSQFFLADSGRNQPC